MSGRNIRIHLSGTNKIPVRTFIYPICAKFDRILLNEIEIEIEGKTRGNRRMHGENKRIYMTAALCSNFEFINKKMCRSSVVLESWAKQTSLSDSALS